MDKTLSGFLVFAIILLLLYTAFEIFMSVSGGRTGFDKEVVPIKEDLGQEVFDHIQETSNYLYDFGD